MIAAAASGEFGDPVRLPTLNSTALGSQKWVPVGQHGDATESIGALKAQGFRLISTNLGAERGGGGDRPLEFHQLQPTEPLEWNVPV